MEKQCINLEQALENLDNDTELVAELAEVLLTDLPKQVRKLANAVEAKDADQIRFWAHSIKGAVGNVCAEKCQDISLEMECMGKDNNLGDIDAKHEILKAAYEELVPQLKELIIKYKE